MENRGRSQTDTDYFLWKEQRGREDLARAIGRAAVDRFDPLLVRELLQGRKQLEFDRLFGLKHAPKTFDVLVTLRKPDARPQEPVRGREARRQHLALLRRTSELAVGRLVDAAAGEGVEVTHRLWLVPAARMRVTEAQLVKIALRRDVHSVTLDVYRLATCLDGSRTQIGADQVQATGITGAGITVAIVDTGVDATHVALTGVVTSQTDLTGSDGSTAEGVGDMVGHGTHCAGIVASQDATFRGIAPGASIADIKSMRNDGAGGGVTNSTIAVNGLTAAVTGGVNVASCSWGGSHANGGGADPP